MSEGSRLPRDTQKGTSWPQGKPAAKTYQRRYEPARSDFTRLLDSTRHEISERTRRVLDYPDSDGEDDTAAQITAQREFEFDIDRSLLPATGQIRENEILTRRGRLTGGESQSDLSEQEESSLASYDSSIFNPKTENDGQNMDRTKTIRNPVVRTEDVDREIERLRIEAARTSAEEVEPQPGTSRAAETRERNYSLAWDDYALPRVAPVSPGSAQKITKLANNHDSDPLTVILERLDSIQARMDALEFTDRRNREPPLHVNQRDRPRSYAVDDPASKSRLREARDMIPTFDGSSEEKLRRFLKACSFAYKIIRPSEELELTEGIICTKLADRALTEVDNRDITTFDQLKATLEACYPIKKTTSQLQREFNHARQRYGEDARAFGNRVDRLTTEWYESATEGSQQSPAEKRAVFDFIKKQALETYQLGLNDRLQTIVRSRAPATLPEAIAEAVGEERIKGITGTTFRPTEPRGYSSEYTSRLGTKPKSCQKCGKIGHLGRDCRSSRFATRFYLPKPEGAPRVNNTEKYCSYCRMNGHTREECRRLRSQTQYVPGKPKEHREPFKTLPPTTYKNERRRTNHSESEKANRTQKLRDYEANLVNHHKETRNTGLDLVLLPIAESRQGNIPLLYDTGSTITFVKARALKGDTLVTDEQVIMTGVTGHHLKTIGYFIAKIKIGQEKLQHKIYVVRNSFPIEYEGILGVDFLQKHKASSNYFKRYLVIREQTLPLIPLQTYLLPARSQTVINATTNSNKVGLVLSQELKPGIFLGNCLVKAVNHVCTVSIINTAEEAVKLTSPYITLEDIIEKKGVSKIPYVGVSKTETPKAEVLKQSLRLQHLNTEEKATIKAICEEYSDIFYFQGDPLTKTDAVTHKITLKSNTAPINVRPYRLPRKHTDEVNRQIKEMLANHIIRPSMSQWNAPLLVVPKKTDASGQTKLRVVIDFRKLNDVTIGDSFPLPNITDILDQLGSAKYFSTLDLASGYHQIAMSQKDKEKTAFSTSNGHYEFNRMPFGLKNSPATFQRLMNTILTGLQGIDCLVYLDDIVIYGASLQQHNERLIKILQRLRENGLKLQPDKCEFLRKEVAYLGHVISDKGISPDPRKISAVKDFPIPKKEKDIQSFLGLAGYYRRFIENFSKIAKPLTLLTRKGQPYIWTNAQQNAFEILKNKLTTAPLLKFPDFTREFIITTDASDHALGGILSQGIIGHDQPVAFASRILTRAEQNYSTTEKELLAIVWAVKHFRPYVYGTKFKIVTDHKPLVWLFNVTDPGSRLIRWRLKLEEYDYEIIHKAGKANTNADALSRPTQANTLIVEEDTTTPEKYNTTGDDKKENVNGNEDESNLSSVREYTEEEKRQILYEYHDAPVGGHQGIQRTIDRIRLNHNWRGLTTDVKNYIDKCKSCQQNKLTRKHIAPLVITDTPKEPFEKCALDIVGPLTTTTNGNKYLLTFQDNLTKYSKAIPLPNQEADTVARAFVKQIVLEHGIPQKVLTDQGTNFLSNLFKNVCKLLKIEKIQTTAYHPQSNGALERSHRTLAEYLRHYIKDEQTDWDEWIPYAMFAYNTTPHTSTKYTPFELLYGHQATLPTALTLLPTHTYTMDDYVSEMRERLRAANKIAKENIKHEKEKNKLIYDRKAKPNVFAKGDKVLLHDETVRRGRSKKLEALWIGPYEIVQKHSDTNYTIKKGRKMLKIHANRIKLFIEN